MRRWNLRNIVQILETHFTSQGIHQDLAALCRDGRRDEKGLQTFVRSGLSGFQQHHRELTCEFLKEDGADGGFCDFAVLTDSGSLVLELKHICGEGALASQCGSLDGQLARNNKNLNCGVVFVTSFARSPNVALEKSNTLSAMTVKRMDDLGYFTFHRFHATLACHDGSGSLMCLFMATPPLCWGYSNEYYRVDFSFSLEQISPQSVDAICGDAAELVKTDEGGAVFRVSNLPHFVEAIFAADHHADLVSLSYDPAVQQQLGLLVGMAYTRYR